MEEISGQHETKSICGKETWIQPQGATGWTRVFQGASLDLSDEGRSKYDLDKTLSRCKGKMVQRGQAAEQDLGKGRNCTTEKGKGDGQSGQIVTVSAVHCVYCSTICVYQDIILDDPEGGYHQT